MFFDELKNKLSKIEKGKTVNDTVALAYSEWLINYTGIRFDWDEEKLFLDEYLEKTGFSRQAISYAILNNPEAKNLVLSNLPKLVVNKEMKDLAVYYKGVVYAKEKPSISTSDIVVSAINNLSMPTRALTSDEFKLLVKFEKNPRVLAEQGLVLNNPLTFIEDGVIGFSYMPDTVLIYTRNSKNFNEGILLDIKSFVKLYEQDLLNKIDFREKEIQVRFVPLTGYRVPCIVESSEYGEEVRVLAEYLFGSVNHKENEYHLTQSTMEV